MPMKQTSPCGLRLLPALKEQKQARLKGGVYHRIQIDLTYNSNHIEGSKLTAEQTRMIFETHAIGPVDTALNVDDITETVNHFRCIDLMIDHAEQELSESLIKDFHRLLKQGTLDSQRDWFATGDYKKLANEVGGMETCPPCKVEEEMKRLLSEYNNNDKHTLEDILDFHVRFEKIHPFQDGNGRVGRLIMFKECLKADVVPFIITEELKYFYYRGLQHWPTTKGYLMDTCLTAQDHFKRSLDYFGIIYSD